MPGAHTVDRVPDYKLTLGVTGLNTADPASAILEYMEILQDLIAGGELVVKGEGPEGETYL